jgi:hypothetical protein
MAYRSGTYVAFHAEDSSDPTESDMKYYRLLQAWHEHDDIEFNLVNSHDKASAVRDTSERATLATSLRERLNNSRNMVLIVGQTTRFDRDWIPFEIEYAVDTCGIPLIAAYPDYQSITDPGALSGLWPDSLAQRIASGTAQVIHVAFRRLPIRAAVATYDHDDLPGGPLTYYTADTYKMWGLR